MEVRMLRSIGRNHELYDEKKPLLEGDEVNIDDEKARKLFEQRLAEPVNTTTRSVTEHRRAETTNLRAVPGQNDLQTEAEGESKSSRTESHDPKPHKSDKTEAKK